MRVVTAVFVGLFGISAFAASGVVNTIVPQGDGAKCFQRRYSAEHLQQNPGQVVTYIELFFDNSDGLDFHLAMKTRNSDSYWMTESANNEHCKVAEDKLSAVCDNVMKFSSLADSLTFEVLANSRVVAEAEGAEQKLVLEGNDKDNNAFKLYPVKCSKIEYMTATLKDQ